MKNFDLKKFITENKATFYSSLNEDKTTSIGKSFFITKGDESMGISPGKYTIVKSYVEDDENVYDIKDQKGKTITVTQDYVQGKGYWKNSPLATKDLSLKESKLRSKIREMVLAEMENFNINDETSEVDFLAETHLGEFGYINEIEVGDKVKASKEYGGLSGIVVDIRGSFIVVKTKEGNESYHESDLKVLNKESKLRSKIREMVLAEMENFNINDETSEYDFLAELEGMLDEKELNQKPSKKDKETEAADDVTVDDTEDVEIEDTEIDTSEVDPTVKAVQDALTQAQAASQKLGDEKLSNQIGNTITYFTRAHISKPNTLKELYDF
jgi:hypothetical protein